jgi:hypothetical protein
MINTLYSNTSFVQQKSEFIAIENEANRNPGNTANEALMERLAKNVPGLKKDDVTDLATNDFSPAKIAERISKFVAMGLENARNEGRSEAEIQSKYEAAMSGVKKGFEEAREILDGLNFLTEDIASNIDKTEDLTFKALEALDPSASNSPSLPVYHTQVAAAERFKSAETFSLDLKTQDGDSVQILFANQSSQEMSYGHVNDGQGNSATSFQFSQSQSSALQFQVSGDLDEGELEAINKLIEDVSKIANEFFNGDVQKAFEQATEFKMDKTELSSMHLQLTKSQEYSAASSYRGIQNNATPDVGKLAGHLLNNFDQAIERPELGFLKDVASVSQQLLDSLVQQDSRFIDANEEQQSSFQASLAKIREVIDSLSSITEQNQQDVNDVLPTTAASSEDS